MSAGRYRIGPSQKVQLADFDPNHTADFKSKSDAGQKLESDIETLAQLQDKFYAQASHGLLIVLQGIDTAGKDGIVKHVMSGINPAGVVVYSFKQPSSEESRHDYLWRCSKALPERGRISIFNRSYYEDVIVTRVHPQLLGQFQKAAEQGDDFWKTRFRDIDNFETYLSHNNIVVLKFFLHISKVEQKKRLIARLNDSTKQWKYSASDLQERAFWDQYVHAYEDALSHTNTCAPWHVIPSNHKWFARLAVADIIVEHLQKLHPEYPRLAADMQEELTKAKQSLEDEPNQTEL